MKPNGKNKWPEGDNTPLLASFDGDDRTKWPGVFGLEKISQADSMARRSQAERDALARYAERKEGK